jgi:hypothetical protein
MMLSRFGCLTTTQQSAYMELWRAAGLASCDPQQPRIYDSLREQLEKLEAIYENLGSNRAVHISICGDFS